MEIFTPVVAMKPAFNSNDIWVLLGNAKILSFAELGWLELKTVIS
jgi:hypothetical protein